MSPIFWIKGFYIFMDAPNVPLNNRDAVKRWIETYGPKAKADVAKIETASETMKALKVMRHVDMVGFEDKPKDVEASTAVRVVPLSQFFK